MSAFEQNGSSTEYSDPEVLPKHCREHRPGGRQAISAALAAARRAMGILKGLQET